jgi:hypothetical protein
MWRNAKMGKDEENKVNVKLQEVELPKLDIQQYIGRKEQISSVETFKSKYGYYLKVSSTVIEVLKRGGELKELRATRLFPLYEDESGKVGWSKKSALGEFLASKRVSEPRDLVGKQVIVQSTVKDGREFLSFI